MMCGAEGHRLAPYSVFTGFYVKLYIMYFWIKIKQKNVQTGLTAGPTGLTTGPTGLTTGPTELTA